MGCGGAPGNFRSKSLPKTDTGKSVMVTSMRE